MQRVLKCDGMIAEKRGSDDRQEDVLPDDLREIKAFVDANRSASTPFDIVLNGSTANLDSSQLQDKFQAVSEAGATWWIEGLWEADEETALQRIRRGTPSHER